MAIDIISLDNKETPSIKGEIAPLMQRMIGAIKTASKATGVDFAYLMNKAAQESGFKPDAKAATSSATGLYQFTEQTWLRTVKEHGGKHELGILADQIALRNDGSATVKDSYIRQQILNLRKNPEVAAVMAAHLAQENKSYLQTEIGGDIGNTELYLAHFLGAHGAARFIMASRGNPQAQAAELLPDAAAANKSVFYHADGRPRTVGQIYDRFAAKMDGKGVTIPDDATPAMLAGIGDVLSRVPELRLPAADALGARIPDLKSVSNTNPNLGVSVAPESLFTVMLLAQLDTLRFGGDAADDKRSGHNGRDDRNVPTANMVG